MSEVQIRKIVYAMLQAGLVEVIQPAVAPATAGAPGGRPGTPPKSFASVDEKRSVVNRLIDRIKRI